MKVTTTGTMPRIQSIPSIMGNKAEIEKQYHHHVIVEIVVIVDDHPIHYI